MSSHKLESYLRTYRIKSGLTQRDVAALLGLGTGSAISRTEKGEMIPSIRILLGYCLLFEVLPSDLVPGIIADIEKISLGQAKVLAVQLRERHATAMVLARLKFLEELPLLMERRQPQKYEQRKDGGNA